tara:strand:- start:556 stop:942 length:387 start_codon:yes stop_codon:yes gene_type:complete
MKIGKVYEDKASVPRECRSSPDLRTSLRAYTARRLLAVADACLTCDTDNYRKEYGFIHRRYAHVLTLITEAVQDVDYMTKSLIIWMQEDYGNAMTSAQKDAAALCATELLLIIEKFNDAEYLNERKQQ